MDVSTLHFEVTLAVISEEIKLNSYVIFRSKFRYEAADFFWYAIEYEFFITIVQVPR